MAVPARIVDQIRRMEPIAAPPDELPQLTELANLFERSVIHRVARGAALLGPRGEQIALPEPLYYLLERLVEVLARGDAVTIVPIGREVTTQQAADILNVSRQYLVRLLDEGRIPHRKTGKHRRLRIEDVLAFKAERDRSRREQIDAIAAMTQDLGGYPEIE